jgi:hypothetical protein
MTQLNRRTALAGLAAVPVAVAMPALAGAVPSSRKFDFGEGARNRYFGVTVMSDLYEPEFPKGSLAIIDPDRAPIDDDLVLVRINWKMFPASAMLLPYQKRAGHDVDGRFCRPGDPREIVASFSGFCCTKQEIDNGTVEIIGTACGWCMQYEWPPCSFVAKRGD